ncbi:type II toxin-antitoxin system PemK/MazF family toxin [Synechococcus sp. CCY 9618]|uniref:type II toxin-antitoxin system PemK/MazF family toxin n=1 Tax=Synechococcus sp. CCY 9618 TaxID=2815602 RepID=UPI001C244D61|nr:type II toxin-antitoxin system PemK/MazF family toxin [Synechococcus sp. CCY 9618]
MPASDAPDQGNLVWLDFILQAGLALLCPVISPIKGYPFEVRLPDGLDVGGVVLSDQLKSLDWRARKARLIDPAPAAVVQQVTDKLIPLLDPAR